MRGIEIITANGTGFWGMPLQVRLATVEYVLTNQWSEDKSHIFRYEIHFSSAAGYQDKRIFRSEDERTLFLKNNFVDLKLSCASEEEISKERDDFLAMITGKPLVEVTYIHHYLQLLFGEDHWFSFYTWPVIEHCGKRLLKHQPGYPETLRSFIEKPVLNVAEYLDAGLVFEFEDGAIKVPLRLDDDTLEPEVAVYHGPDGVWNVWRKGEEFI